MMRMVFVFSTIRFLLCVVPFLSYPQTRTEAFTNQVVSRTAPAAAAVIGVEDRRRDWYYYYDYYDDGGSRRTLCRQGNSHNNENPPVYASCVASPTEDTWAVQDDSDNSNDNDDDESGLVVNTAVDDVATTSRSVMEQLQARVFDNNNTNETSLIEMEAYVISNKARSIGKKIAFVDFHVVKIIPNPNDNVDATSGSSSSAITLPIHSNVVDNSTASTSSLFLCQALLRQDIYVNKGGTHYKGYRKCLVRGCKYRIHGYPSCTNIPNNVVFTITKLELLGLSRTQNPQHLQSILNQACIYQTIPIQEFLHAITPRRKRTTTRSQSSPSRVSGTTTSNVSATQQQQDDEELRALLQKLTTGYDNNSKLQLKRITQQFLAKLPDDPPAFPQYITTLDTNPNPKRTTDGSTSPDPGRHLPLAPSDWQSPPPQGTTPQQRKDSTSITTPTSIRNSTTTTTTSSSTLTPVSLIGWVQNRRRFQNDITMMYVEKEDDDNSEDDEYDRSEPPPHRTHSHRIPCLLHPDVLAGSAATTSGQEAEHGRTRNRILRTGREEARMYQNLVAVGAKVAIRGYQQQQQHDTQENTATEASAPGTTVVWVHHIHLLQCSSGSIGTIRFLLDLLYEQQISTLEVWRALGGTIRDDASASASASASDRPGVSTSSSASSSAASSIISIQELEQIQQSGRKGSHDNSRSSISSSSSVTERQWLANNLAIRLQQHEQEQQQQQQQRENRHRPPKKRRKKPIIDPALLHVLERYRYLSTLYPVIDTDIQGNDLVVSTTNTDNEISTVPVQTTTNTAASTTGILTGTATDNMNTNTSKAGNSKAANNSNSHDTAILTSSSSNKMTNITIDNNGNRMRVRPSVVRMPGSKWETKKKPQLEWMGHQIQKVLESHPEFRKRTLTILDIGGGKGLLANYLGKQFKDENVRIRVIDICPGAIKNGSRKAMRLNVPVSYECADASSPELLLVDDDDTDNDAARTKPDFVVALHACGHLSDIALNHAAHHRAGFVIVPCCFNSNPHLTIPSIVRHHSNGSSPDRGSSSISDQSILSNTTLTTTKTSVADWLGIEEASWSALKLIAEVQGDFPLSSEAIGLVCAVRAKALSEKIFGEIPTPDELCGGESASGTFTAASTTTIYNTTQQQYLKRNIEIKRFPIQYSTRNTALIGTVPPPNSEKVSGGILN